jgi:hypothetical protein
MSHFIPGTIIITKRKRKKSYTQPDSYDKLSFLLDLHSVNQSLRYWDLRSRSDYFPSVSWRE